MLLASSCVLVVVVVVVHPAINVNNAVAPIIMKKIRFTWFFLYLRITASNLLLQATFFVSLIKV